jgi:hypothetical protein
MAEQRRRNFRGVAEPVFVREPLLVRLCAAFVDNFTLILRTALVIGAVLLVHDLRTVVEKMTQPVAESVPTPAAPVEIEAIGTTEAQEPVLNESVMHALNCTYGDYRNAHYDECVTEPSRIYQRPQADPDDTGLVIYDAPVMYARLDDYTSLKITIGQQGSSDQQ